MPETWRTRPPQWREVSRSLKQNMGPRGSERRKKESHLVPLADFTEGRRRPGTVDLPWQTYRARDPTRGSQAWGQLSQGSHA